MKENGYLNSKVKRIHIILLVSAIIFILAGIRWQAVDASKLKDVANQRESSSEINAVRGTIYAKDGTTLAYSEPRFNMFIWAGDLDFFESDKIKLQTRQEFLDKVAPIINTTPTLLGEKIQNYLDQGTRWMPIANDLSDQQWSALNNLKTDKYDAPLRGFHFVNVSKRIYPNGRLASQLLGLTNTVDDKVIGLGGIEGAWNETLNPIKGIITQENNAKGGAIATALTVTTEAKNGSDLYTSIDKKLQAVVEQKIKEGVVKYKAKSGTVLIMDPKTGQIMALANYPDYDPNLRQETDPNVYGDSAVTSPYEMGSIGKALTISAAVDLNRVDANTIILPKGHNGCEKFTDELGPLCTADHKPQPPMPLKDCFALSDNICLFHLAKEHMSKEEFRDYLVRFGIGQSSGVDLANESESPLRPLSEWTIGDVASDAYGHGYSVDLIQAADAIATIANNGVRMKPYVVTKIVDSDGNVDEFKPEVITTVMRPETASKLIDMMSYNFTTKGIAPNEWVYKNLYNYKLCVKSGTALIADSTGYSDEVNASFVGYDCSDQRTFLMFIKLQQPEVPASRLAFYNVRPLWLDTFESVKDLIGVPTK